MNPARQYVVGVMTGTSMDALDAALIERNDPHTPTLLHHTTTPLGPMASRLRAAAEQHPLTAGEFAKLSWDFALLNVAALEHLLIHQPTPSRIVIHGQTIYHQPPYSWQLINPAPIAARFRCPVIYDLRQADLARGGQGAPITHHADWQMFRHQTRARAIINLGGYCNMSILPAAATPDAAQQVRGLDVCACNQVLDAAARAGLGQPYDIDGRAAASGAVHDDAAMQLFAILQHQRDQDRSLGTGDEAANWVHDYAPQLAGADLAASAVRAIALCISETVQQYTVDEVIVAGGGVKNTHLLTTLTNAIQQHISRPVQRSDAFGVPIDAREAMAIAILGSQPGGYSTFTCS